MSVLKKMLYHVMLVLLYSKGNKLYIYIYPLFWTSFPFRSPEGIEYFPIIYSRFS